MGWTAPGSHVAFLCRDGNGNGVIDDGSEMFGNGVLLADGTHARNGFVALAQFDANRDAVIDENDGIWNELLLWRDENHDAISQPSEVDPAGNLFRYEATLRTTCASRPIYDVYFVSLDP